VELRKVTAIIRSHLLDKVEEHLQQMGVKGLSVSHVKGYGEYANFFTHNWLVRHTKIEIFAEKTRAESIARAIMDVAHTGGPGDGLIALQPVEKIYRIRTKAEATPEEMES